MVQRRRSSLRISLLLVGVAGLAGCGPGPRTEVRRDIYASIEDCKADWTREDLCEATPQAHSGFAGAYGSHYFVGPRYSWSRDWDAETRSAGSTETRPAGSRALSSVAVERGGFGSTALFHSSGG